MNAFPADWTCKAARRQDPGKRKGLLDVNLCSFRQLRNAIKKDLQFFSQLVQVYATAVKHLDRMRVIEHCVQEVLKR